MKRGFALNYIYLQKILMISNKICFRPLLCWFCFYNGKGSKGFVIVALLQLFHLLAQLGFQVHEISGLCGLKHGLFKEKRNNAKFMNHLQYIHNNQTCRLACMFFSVEYIIFSFQSSIKARQKITNL